MKRIMIVGGIGAGKSTLAVTLGQLTGQPVYHLDRLFWRAGHVALPRAARMEQVAAVLAGPGYVLEGGYSFTYPDRLADCDTVIWLDLGVLRRFPRFAMRKIRNWGKVRPDQADGCPDGYLPRELRLWLHFWRNRKRMRRDVAEALAKTPPGTRLLHLRSPREVQAFLDALRQG